MAWLFLDKNRSLSLLVINIYKNRAIKISLFNYSMLGYILPRTIFQPHHLQKKFLTKSTFLNAQSKLVTCFLYQTTPDIFQTNLILFIRDLCRCLQPCLISSTTFGEKLAFTTANHIWIYYEIKYKFIMDLTPNDWKHLLKTETSQKKNPF